MFLVPFALLLFAFTRADDGCACSRKGLRPCEGGMYVDYYYKKPFVGHPRDSQYLPPEDTVPDILERVTSIRDTVQDFLNTFNQQSDNPSKALWMRQNFEQVRYLLRAVDRAANATTTH